MNNLEKSKRKRRAKISVPVRLDENIKNKTFIHVGGSIARR